MTEQKLHEPTLRDSSRRGGWIGGAMLVTLGLILLLQNLTGFTLHNWWALFILLPAVGAFTAAESNFRKAGHMTPEVRASFFGGFILCLVAASFLFRLDWALVGPGLIILTGLALLFNSILPR